MELRWTNQALADLVRLHEFLAAVNPTAATRTVQALAAAPERLREHPRIGKVLEEFAPREVRRILAGSYELRYEVRESNLYILRLWHTRESRDGPAA